MRRLHSFPAALLLLVGLAAPAAGQQVCRMLPGAQLLNRVVSGGRETIFISGPVDFRCTGGITIRADSAVTSRGGGPLELIDRVFYQDSVKTLTADWLNYLARQKQLFARGDVELTARDDGSVISGPRLEYRGERPGRDQAETIVEGEGEARAHARMYPRSGEGGADAANGRPAASDRPEPGADAGPPPASDTAASPLDVDADRIELTGEDAYRAIGRVELRRGDTRGYGREATFDRDGGRFRLMGDARVASDEYDLSGAEIEGVLAGDTLRDVVARGDAVLTADELQVTAPTLRIHFRDGEVHRLVAVREAADEPAFAAARPRARAQDVELVADSIDALAPTQRLERVVAVGDAYGERTADSLGVELPGPIARDWIRGDTIVGYFREATARAAARADSVEPTAADTAADDAVDRARAAALDTAAAAPSAPADSAGERRMVLDRIVAVGVAGDARSVYRVWPENAEADRPDVNYIIARRITLSFGDDGVRLLEADGPIRGIHLQPGRDSARTRDAEGTLAPAETDTAEGADEAQDDTTPTER